MLVNSLRRESEKVPATLLGPAGVAGRPRWCIWRVGGWGRFPVRNGGPGMVCVGGGVPQSRATGGIRSVRNPTCPLSSTHPMPSGCCQKWCASADGLGMIAGPPPAGQSVGCSDCSAEVMNGPRVVGPLDLLNTRGAGGVFGTGEICNSKIRRDEIVSNYATVFTVRSDLSWCHLSTSRSHPEITTTIQKPPGNNSNQPKIHRDLFLCHNLGILYPIFLWY